jgi:enoyl-CoA hydratase/carnithine racemase
VEENLSEKQIIVDIDKGVGIITLKRPPTNAFSSGLFGEMFRRFEELGKNDAVRVIVVTGGIRNCFSTGADLDELFGEGTANDLSRGNYQGFFGVQKGYEDIERISKPVIAAINGVAIGAGLELALLCDLRVASELSYFSLPEAAKQITPVIGGTQRLTRLIGPGRAKEMLMLGKMIRAETALQWGLVNWIVPPDKVLPTALEKARDLVESPPQALTAIKKLVYIAQEEKLETGMGHEVELFIDLMKQKLLGGERKEE